MDTLSTWIDGLSEAYSEEDLQLMSEYIGMGNSLAMSSVFIMMILKQVKKDVREKAGLHACLCSCHIKGD